MIHVLRKIELTLAAVAVIALVLCSLAIILLRLFAATAWSVSAVDFLSQYPSHLMLISALLGGSLAMSRGEILKIEVLNNLIGSRSRQFVARLVAAVAFIFFGVFIALVVRYLTIDYRTVVAAVYLPLMLLLWFKTIYLVVAAKSVT